MIVAVLMISCQVSTVPIKKYDGAHTNTSTTQNAKNQARENNPDAFPANLSKNPSLDDTSDGICADETSTTVFTISTSKTQDGPYTDLFAQVDRCLSWFPRDGIRMHRATTAKSHCRLHQLHVDDPPRFCGQPGLAVRRVG
jgi:hypothetical protein